MIELAKLMGARLGLDVEELHTTTPPVFDFVRTAWIAVVLLLIRLAAERIWVPILSSVLKRVKPSVAKKAAAIFDDAFIATMSALLEGLAVYITLTHNGGCTPWSTDVCLVGWPSHSLSFLQRLYFVLMFQYYLYEMIGTALKMGTVLKTEMVVHHIASMILLGLAYHINLVRFGTMWQALFDLSNPVLHMAKVVHALQAPVLKDLMLPLFALVFFAVRVAAAPLSVVVPAVTLMPVILPTSWAVASIGLLLFVCILQVFWFYKIVKMALKDNKGGKAD